MPRINNGNQGGVTSSAEPTNSGVPHANDFDDVWCAARRGDRNAVRAFLDNGTDPDIEDECGNPPLYYSVLYGHRKICKDLVRSGANVHSVPHINVQKIEELQSYKLSTSAKSKLPSTPTPSVIEDKFNRIYKARNHREETRDGTTSDRASTYASSINQDASSIASSVRMDRFSLVMPKILGYK